MFSCQDPEIVPPCLQMVCHCAGDRLVVPPLEEAIPGVESAGSSPKDRARFYTSRIREGYTPAQQLMIEKIRLESNAWEGLEESWELGDVSAALLEFWGRPLNFFAVDSSM